METTDRQSRGVRNRRQSLLAVLALGLLLTATGAGAERTLQCGHRLVSVGDSAAEVRDRCGVPDHVEHREEGRDTYISQYYDYEEERYKAPRLTKGPIQVEIWTYDFGPNRFTRYLHFENGRLIRIETGEKARD